MTAGLDHQREHRLDPAQRAGGRESYSFEAIADDRTCLLVRWTLVDAQCWYWAYLMQPDATVLAVRADDLALPRGRSLEVRGDGIWADGTCEVAHEHWSLGLEAFAVHLDDASQGWHSERGDLTPFGFELDFESEAESQSIRGGYAQVGSLRGELIVGRTVRPVDVRTIRTHRLLHPAGTDVELRSEHDGQLRVDALTAHDLERGPDAMVTEASSPTGRFVVDAAVAIPTAWGRIFVGAGHLRGAASPRFGWLEALG